MNRTHHNPLMAGRLNKPPAPSLIGTAFSFEVADGPALYKGMSLADIAYTVHLIEGKLIPSKPGSSLLGVLLDLHRIPGNEFPFDSAYGDVYTNREHIIRELSNDGSEWLGLGRARRECTTVGYVWLVCERLLEFTNSLITLSNTLLRLAMDHLMTLVPDYTYLQRAQPTSLAHYLLSFVYPLQRDLERVYSLYQRLERIPIGMGSVNGSRLPLNRERLRELLGFQALAENTRDAMWMADLAVETMSLIQISLLNLDRLVEDIQIWATQEYQFIELSDRHSRISVIMPHKKNPYALSFIRGICRQVLGNVVSVAASNLTPSGQVDNRIIAYGQVPQSLSIGRQVVDLMNDVLQGMTIHRDRMEAAIDPTLATTDLAEMLVLEGGLAPRTAHRVVGIAVRTALDHGCELSYELLRRELEKETRQPMPITLQQFERCLNPLELIMTRNGIGGAAPRAIEDQVEKCRNQSIIAKSWYQERVLARQFAETNLLKRANKLVGELLQMEELG